MGAYKCCNPYCEQSFDDKNVRDRHEEFCSVPPPPDPSEPKENRWIAS